MRPRSTSTPGAPAGAIGGPAGLPRSALGSQTLRLLAILGATNLAFWLLWPAGIVVVESLGWGPALTGIFGSVAWIACVAGLLAAPRTIRRVGAQRTTLLASGLMFAAALGMAVEPAGVLAWLWTSQLGLALGLRWPAVDSWLADGTPSGAKGRALSLSETLAGATFMLGPALAASLGSIALVGWVAALCAGAGLVLTYATIAPPSVHHVPPAGGSGRLRALALVAPVALVAALWGGLFESGFSATASLLTLEAEDGAKQPWALWAAAATGAGSFAGQYGLGVLSDRWGARPVLLGVSATLAAALGALALLPSALMGLAVAVGAAGGGLYTVAVVGAVQVSTDDRGSAGMISLMALLYTLGTLAAPMLAGTIIAAAGTGGLLLTMALASAALVAGLGFAKWTA